MLDNRSKVVLFDFDGVLVDSFEPAYEINRAAAEKIGKSLTRKEYRDFFNGSLHKRVAEYIGDDDLQKTFSEYKYKIFADIYNEKTVKLFDFSERLIINLAEISVLRIVSSAPESVISGILKNKKLDQYFESISGLNKSGKRETIIKQQEGDGRKYYFVTDTSGDVLEVQGLNVVSLGVTWGFHDEKQLATASPSYVVQDHRELISLLFG